MKKLALTIVCLLALSFTAIPVGAQTRARCNSRTSYDRRYEQRYDRTRNVEQRYDRTRNVVDSNNVIDSNQVYQNENYQYDTNGYEGYYDNRSRWDKSRDKITTAIGAGTGAVVGGLIGGKRGAMIGAITGGGGAAIYTYKIRDKYPTY